MMLIYVLKEKIEPKLTTQWESLNDKQDKKEREKKMRKEFLLTILDILICM